MNVALINIADVFPQSDIISLIIHEDAKHTRKSFCLDAPLRVFGDIRG